MLQAIFCVCVVVSFRCESEAHFLSLFMAIFCGLKSYQLAYKSILIVNYS